MIGFVATPGAAAQRRDEFPTSYVVQRPGSYYSGDYEFNASEPENGAKLFFSVDTASIWAKELRCVLVPYEQSLNGRVRCGYVLYRPVAYWRRSVGVLSPWVPAVDGATVFQTHGGALSVSKENPGTIVVSGHYATGSYSLFAFAGLTEKGQPS